MSRAWSINSFFLEGAIVSFYILQTALSLSRQRPDILDFAHCSQSRAGLSFIWGYYHMHLEGNLPSFWLLYFLLLRRTGETQQCRTRCPRLQFLDCSFAFIMSLLLYVFYAAISLASFLFCFFYCLIKYYTDPMYTSSILFCAASTPQTSFLLVTLFMLLCRTMWVWDPKTLRPGSTERLEHFCQQNQHWGNRCRHLLSTRRERTHGSASSRASPARNVIVRAPLWDLRRATERQFDRRAKASGQALGNRARRGFTWWCNQVRSPGGSLFTAWWKTCRRKLHSIWHSGSAIWRAFLVQARIRGSEQENLTVYCLWL